MTRKLLFLVSAVVLLVGAVVLLSCDTIEPVGPDAGVKEPPVIKIQIDSDTLSMSGRVVAYDVQGFETANLSPMKAAPERPPIDVDMSQGYDPNEVKESQNFWLPPSTSLVADIRMTTGSLYYIEGDLTINSIVGQSSRIIIMPGGRLSLMVAHIPSGLTIHNYGAFELPSMVTIDRDALLSTVGNLSVTTLNVQGGLYVGGDFMTTDFRASTESVSKFSGCATIGGQVVLDAGSTVFVDKLLTCEKVLELNSSARISIAPKAVFSAMGLNVIDPLARIECWGDDYAVVNLGQLTIKSSNMKSNFRGFLDVHFGSFNNQAGQEVEMLSQIKLNGNTYISGDGCRPEFGTPSMIPTKEYILDQVAEIMPADNVSAVTDVKNYGSVTFVSWCNNANTYKGAVDLVNVDSRQITLSIKFADANVNHMAVDEHGLWCAGGDSKGAFLCQSVFGNDFVPSANKLPRMALPGKSANCVFRCGASVVASSADTGGFAVVDLLRGDILSFKRVDHAKYAHLNGGTLITLTAGLAPEVSVYDAAVLDFDSPPRNTFPIGLMDHMDVRNMSLVDGSNVYISLGTGGVKTFVEGVEKAHFVNDRIYGGSAQGMDYDQRFLYVANGKQGLVVLDKTTLKPVAQYQFAAVSANTVTKGRDGLIYVTYGSAGVKVFSLIEKIS